MKPMIKSYWTSAWRHLKKKKGFSFINIFALTVGMAAALLILTYVIFEYSFDGTHSERENIYRVESTFHEGNELTDNWATSSFGYGSAMKQEFPWIKDYTRVGSQYQPEQIVKYGNQINREAKIAYADHRFFRVFDFELVKGDPDKVLDAPNKVVITERIAKKYFKEADPIGKIMIFKADKEQLACEVSGVMKEMPSNSHIRYNFLISYLSLPKFLHEYWYRHETYTYVVVGTPEQARQIEAGFPAMAEKYKTDEALRNKIWGVELVPLEDIHLSLPKAYETEVKGNRSSMVALIVAAIAILCIAWINYVNLTVVRSMERAREVGIRRVSGATRKQLITQFLFEALLNNAIAFVLALGMLEVALPAFDRLTGRELDLWVWFRSAWSLLIVFVFAMGVFLSGFYPAVILSGTKPMKMLKGKFIHSNKAGITRKVLVIVQYAASMILICCTLVVFAQLNFMRNKALGVRTNEVLILKTPGYTEDMSLKLQAVKRELALLPGVKGVTVSSAIPGVEVGMFLSIRRANDVTRQNRLYEMLACDEDYLKAYDLEPVAGRIFSEDFGGDNDKLVINEAAVRNLGFSDNNEVLGQLISVETVEEPMQVIGVVKNFHQQSLNKDYTPIMFFQHEHIPWFKQRYISIVMQDGNPRLLVEKAHRTWERYFADSSFDYFFLDNFFDQQYRQDEVFGLMVALFAGLAIFISCVGLWVLVMFACTLRTKEMGIRKVLGASNLNLFYQLGHEFLLLIGIAVLIALPLSWLIMTSWLGGYPFRVEWEWWFFGLPVVLLFVISVITIGWQTAKTVFSKPARSLRYE